MKTTKTRKHYLLPLMAVTALSLSLAACDDKKEDTAAGTEITTEAPAVEEAAPVVTSIQAQGATAYATAEGSTNGAVFLTLHNPNAAADRLVGASTPVATSVEFHQTSTDANGVASMNKIDAIEIPAGQQVVLSADGYHIMLLGLNAPLAEGTPFDITLDFENAADVILPVTVMAPVADATEAHDGHDHGDHGDDAATETTTTPTADESPAPEETITPTDEPAPDAATEAPAADAPVDEQPAQ